MYNKPRPSKPAYKPQEPPKQVGISAGLMMELTEQCPDLPETGQPAPAAVRALQSPGPGLHPGTQPVQQAAHHHLPGSQAASTRL